MVLSSRKWSILPTSSIVEETNSFDYKEKWLLTRIGIWMEKCNATCFLFIRRKIGLIIILIFLFSQISLFF
jgi:hypothetical protein